MGGKIVALVVAAFSGVAMAVQGSLNAVLGKRAGLLEAVFVVHMLGTLILAALLVLGRAGKGNLANLVQVPWYLWLGGPLSVVIVYTVVASINRVGVSFATTAIIIGQVLTALIIDHLGLWGLTRTELSWWKLPGLLLFALGAKLLLTRGN